MGKDNFKNEFTKIINDKKFLNIVTIALVLAFVLLAVSFLTTGRKKSTSPTNGGVESPIANASEDGAKSKEILSYEETQRKELVSILNKMDGVGEVEVMMHFASGEVKVPAIDQNTQVSVTEEADRDGGKRVQEQQTDGSKIVMSGNGSENEPFILQTYKPQITGIVIVAEGAESEKVKYDVQTAISSLYGLSLDKVNVYPMQR